MATTSNFNPFPDLHAMQATAKADLVGARFLWNLGLIAQSIWLLQQSAEKYLKCLWAKNKTFSGKDDLQRKFKSLGHNTQSVFDSLDPNIQKQITLPMWFVSLDSLRYNAGFGYSYSIFRAGEKFINQIRKLLGEPIQRNHLAEWERTAMRISFDEDQQIKATKAVKLVLSITNPKTKREKKAHRREWKRAIASLSK